MRLHPAASRIGKLAGETPALLIVFDLLRSPDGRSWRSSRCRATRRARELLRRPRRRRPAPLARYAAPRRGRRAGWREQAVARSTASSPSGWTSPIAPASGRCSRSSACARPTASSAASAMAPAAVWSDRCCSASTTTRACSTMSALPPPSPTSNARRSRASSRALRGGPGFTGDAPGGPSRWSTERSAQWEPLKPKLVVEVHYDHVTGHRFRHGTRFVRWRPDKPPGQCTFDQLQREAAPAPPQAQAAARLGR